MRFPFATSQSRSLFLFASLLPHLQQCLIFCVICGHMPFFLAQAAVRQICKSAALKPITKITFFCLRIHMVLDFQSIQTHRKETFLSAFLRKSLCKTFFRKLFYLVNHDGWSSSFWSLTSMWRPVWAKSGQFTCKVKELYNTSIQNLNFTLPLKHYY